MYNDIYKAVFSTLSYGYPFKLALFEIYEIEIVFFTALANSVDCNLPGPAFSC